MGNPRKKWDKEDNLNKLLTILKDLKEAKFRTLKEQLGVSEPTLTDYIKELEKQQKIEHFEKSEDRRKTWYKIKLENTKIVEAQIRTHEAIQFIENLSDPFVSYVPRQSFSVSAFSSIPGAKHTKNEEESLNKGMFEFAELIDLFLEGNLPKKGKLALVITISGVKNDE